MRAVDLIRKKRDSGELSRDEIAFLVTGYTRGEIPDYQMAAWLMADSRARRVWASVCRA